MRGRPRRRRQVLSGRRPTRSVHSAWSTCCGLCVFVNDEDDERPEAISRLSSTEVSALNLSRDSDLSSHPSSSSSYSAGAALQLGDPRAPRNIPVAQLSRML